MLPSISAGTKRREVKPVGFRDAESERFPSPGELEIDPTLRSAVLGELSRKSASGKPAAKSAVILTVTSVVDVEA